VALARAPEIAANVSRAVVMGGARQRHARRVEFRFRFEPLLKTKGRIGFAS
jgi:inosine-uridine nucleoside N-ribohydrolase